MGRATSHTRKDYETLLDISRLYYNLMSRARVYPQDITQDITLTSGANPNQFGAWTNVIPAGVVGFPFRIFSLSTEGASETDAYFVQFASSQTPTEADMLGEKRLRAAAAGRSGLEIIGPHLPPGTSVWGRVKSALGGNTLDISVKLIRSVCPSKLDEIAPWPAFPW